MDWNQVLNTLLDHPYWFDFQGALTSSWRFFPPPMRILINQEERQFDIRAQYLLEFGLGPFDPREDCYNAFRVSLGDCIFRVQSVIREAEGLYIAKDVVTFESQPLEDLECALASWAALPVGTSIAKCRAPPPHSRSDLIALLREYTK